MMDDLRVDDDEHGEHRDDDCEIADDDHDDDCVVTPKAEPRSVQKLTAHLLVTNPNYSLQTSGNAARHN